MRASVLVGVVVASALGCVGKPVEEQSAGLAISPRNVVNMGELAYGEDATSTTSAGRRYRAWTFAALAGDVLDIRVTSRYGDPVSYLCDANLGILVKNDDAGDEGAAYPTDSRITTTIATAGSYRIVVKDYNGERRRFTIQLRATPGADPAWDAAAIEAAERIVYDGPMPEAVDLESAPAAARARYEASASVLETPTVFLFEVMGRPVYVVMATDGSGEGNQVAVDLVDGAGRWFAHAMGHQVWDGGGLSWSVDPEDPTLCACTGASDTAQCTWIDGTQTPSSRLCE